MIFFSLFIALPCFSWGVSLKYLWNKSFLRRRKAKTATEYKYLIFSGEFSNAPSFTGAIGTKVGTIKSRYSHSKENSVGGNESLKNGRVLSKTRGSRSSNRAESCIFSLVARIYLTKRPWTPIKLLLCLWTHTFKDRKWPKNYKSRKSHSKQKTISRNLLKPFKRNLF